MKRKKTITMILAAAALTASLSSCVNEMGSGRMRGSETEVAFSAVSVGGEDTKSILTVGEAEVNQVFLAAYRQSDGKLQDSRNFTGNSGTLKLITGTKYNIYALVNMKGSENFRIPVTESDLVGGFSYSIPDYASINTYGMPMSGVIKDIDPKTTHSVSISVRRLLAKLVIKIDHTGITGLNGASPKQNFENLSLYIRNANRTLYPFRTGGSSALSASDILPSSDYSADMGAEVTSYSGYSSGAVVDDATFVYYVPENRQGLSYNAGTDLYGPLISNSDPKQKIPSVVSSQGKNPDLLTYVEFTGRVPDTDGYGGTIKYRFYLGHNDRDNFDIRRNDIYQYNLSFLLQTALDESEWECEHDSWTDSRRLAVVSTVDAKQFNSDSVVIVRPGSSKSFFVYYSGSGNHADDDPMETEMVGGAVRLKYNDYGKMVEPGSAITGLAQGSSGWYTNFYASDMSKAPEGLQMSADGVSISYDAATQKFTFTASSAAVTGKEYNLNFFLNPGRSTAVKSVKLIVLEPLSYRLYYENGTAADPSNLYEGFGVWVEVRGIVSDKYSFWDYGRPSGDTWPSQCVGLGAHGNGSDHAEVSSPLPPSYSGAVYKYPRVGTATTFESKSGYVGEYDKSKWVYLVLSEGTTSFRIKGQHRYDTEEKRFSLTAKPVELKTVRWQENCEGQTAQIAPDTYTFFIDGTVFEGDSWTPVFYSVDDSYVIPEEYFTQAYCVFTGGGSRYLVYPSVFARGTYGTGSAGFYVNDYNPPEYAAYLPFYGHAIYDVNIAVANSGYNNGTVNRITGGWVSGATANEFDWENEMNLPAGDTYSSSRVFIRPWATWERKTFAGHTYSAAHIYIKGMDFANHYASWDPSVYSGRVFYEIDNPEIPYTSGRSGQRFEFSWRIPFPWASTTWASDYYVSWKEGGFTWKQSSTALCSSPENVTMTFPYVMLNQNGEDLRSDMSYTVDTPGRTGYGSLIWNPNTQPGKMFSDEHFYAPNGNVRFVKTIRNIHSGESVSRDLQISLKHRLGVCRYAEFLNNCPDDGKNTVRIWLVVPRRAYLDSRYNHGTVENPDFMYGSSHYAGFNAGGIDAIGAYNFRAYAGFFWGIGSGPEGYGYWNSSLGTFEQTDGPNLKLCCAEYTFVKGSSWDWSTDFISDHGTIPNAEQFVSDPATWWDEFYVHKNTSATSGMYLDYNGSNITIFRSEQPRFMDVNTPPSYPDLNMTILKNDLGGTGITIESIEILPLPDCYPESHMPYVIRNGGGM